MITGFILYGLLGAVLSMAGVGIMDKPWEFLVIMALVAFIDLNSKFS